MVITSRVRTMFFVPTSNVSETLIRLPSSIVGQYETKCEHSGQVVASQERPPNRANIWSSDEHDRFLHGLELFPNGPWKEVAAIMATKTTRQTMTHAQKYRQKIERRLTVRPRWLKKRRKDTAEAEVATKHSLSELLMTESAWGAIRCGGPTSPVDVTSYPSAYSSRCTKFSDMNEYNVGTSNRINGSGCLHDGSVTYPRAVEVSAAEDDLLDSINFEKEFESLIASLRLCQ